MQYPGFRVGVRFAVMAALAGALHAGGAVAAPLDTRWDASLAEFDASDKQRAPAAGGIVFVGSSSIRLWPDLESRFGQLPVIKRGFGGSRLADCASHVDRLVNRYKPRHVVVYAGDNDLAEGSTPADVLASFQSFVSGVREAVPEARISYVSIKPSPLRANLLESVREANRLIRQYTEAHPGQLDYVDVFTPMLDQAGTPRADLYSADALHMNDAGYALWQQLISARIR
jgi:lysophospholipase L1-like esterase